MKAKSKGPFQNLPKATSALLLLLLHIFIITCATALKVSFSSSSFTKLPFSFLSFFLATFFFFFFTCSFVCLDWRNVRDERKLRLGSPLRDVRGERQRKAEMHSDPASESDIQGGIPSEIPAKGKKKKQNLSRYFIIEFWVLTDLWGVFVILMKKRWGGFRSIDTHGLQPTTHLRVWEWDREPEASFSHQLINRTPLQTSST